MSCRYAELTAVCLGSTHLKFWLREQIFFQKWDVVVKKQILWSDEKKLVIVIVKHVFFDAVSKTNSKMKCQIGSEKFKYRKRREWVMSRLNQVLIRYFTV